MNMKNWLLLLLFFSALVQAELLETVAGSYTSPKEALPVTVTNCGENCAIASITYPASWSATTRPVFTIYHVTITRAGAAWPGGYSQRLEWIAGLPPDDTKCAAQQCTAKMRYAPPSLSLLSKDFPQRSSLDEFRIVLELSWIPKSRTEQLERGTSYEPVSEIAGGVRGGYAIPHAGAQTYNDDQWTILKLKSGGLPPDYHAAPLNQGTEVAETCGKAKTLAACENLRAGDIKGITFLRTKNGKKVCSFCAWDESYAMGQCVAVEPVKEGYADYALQPTFCSLPENAGDDCCKEMAAGEAASGGTGLGGGSSSRAGGRDYSFGKALPGQPVGVTQVPDVAVPCSFASGTNKLTCDKIPAGFDASQWGCFACEWVDKDRSCNPKKVDCTRVDKSNSVCSKKPKAQCDERIVHEYAAGGYYQCLWVDTEGVCIPISADPELLSPPEDETLPLSFGGGRGFLENMFSLPPSEASFHFTPELAKGFEIRATPSSFGSSDSPQTVITATFTYEGKAKSPTIGCVLPESEACSSAKMSVADEQGAVVWSALTKGDGKTCTCGAAFILNPCGPQVCTVTAKWDGSQAADIGVVAPAGAYEARLAFIAIENGQLKPGKETPKKVGVIVQYAHSELFSSKLVEVEQRAGAASQGEKFGKNEQYAQAALSYENAYLRQFLHGVQTEDGYGLQILPVGDSFTRLTGYSEDTTVLEMNSQEVRRANTLLGSKGTLKDVLGYTLNEEMGQKRLSGISSFLESGAMVAGMESYRYRDVLGLRAATTPAEMLKLSSGQEPTLSQWAFLVRNADLDPFLVAVLCARLYGGSEEGYAKCIYETTVKDNSLQNAKALRFANVLQTQYAATSVYKNAKDSEIALRQARVWLTIGNSVTQTIGGFSDVRYAWLFVVPSAGFFRVAKVAAGVVLAPQLATGAVMEINALSSAAVKPIDPNDEAAVLQKWEEILGPGTSLFAQAGAILVIGKIEKGPSKTAAKDVITRRIAASKLNPEGEFLNSDSLTRRIYSETENELRKLGGAPEWITDEDAAKLLYTREAGRMNVRAGRGIEEWQLEWDGHRGISAKKGGQTIELYSSEGFALLGNAEEITLMPKESSAPVTLNPKDISYTWWLEQNAKAAQKHVYLSAYQDLFEKIASKESKGKAVAVVLEIPGETGRNARWVGTRISDREWLFDRGTDNLPEILNFDTGQGVDLIRNAKKINVIELPFGSKTRTDVPLLRDSTWNGVAKINVDHPKIKSLLESLRNEKARVYGSKKPNFIGAGLLVERVLEENYYYYKYPFESTDIEATAKDFGDVVSFGDKQHAWLDAKGRNPAICRHYSVLAGILLEDLGYHYTQVNGYALGGAHSWGEVLVDGNWRPVDFTGGKFEYDPAFFTKRHYLACEVGNGLGVQMDTSPLSQTYTYTPKGETRSVASMKDAMPADLWAEPVLYKPLETMPERGSIEEFYSAEIRFNKHGDNLFVEPVKGDVYVNYEKITSETKITNLDLLQTYDVNDGGVLRTAIIGLGEGSSGYGKKIFGTSYYVDDATNAVYYRDAQRWIRVPGKARQAIFRLLVGKPRAEPSFKGLFHFTGGTSWWHEVYDANGFTYRYIRGLWERKYLFVDGWEEVVSPREIIALDKMREETYLNARRFGAAEEAQRSSSALAEQSGPVVSMLDSQKIPRDASLELAQLLRSGEFQKITAFHGTGSGALYGILREGELLPFGELEKHGVVPFTGELEMGVSSKGINLDSISVVGFDNKADFSWMLNNYAKGFGEKPWTPEISAENVQTLREVISNTKNYEQYNAGSPIYEATKATYEGSLTALDVEQKRLAAWEGSLTANEQELVSHPYAIVFGIKEIEPEFVMYGEGRIRGSVPLTKTVIFTESAKMSEVRGLLEQTGLDVAVYSMESLELMDSLSNNQAIFDTYDLYASEKAYNRLNMKLRPEFLDYVADGLQNYANTPASAIPNN